MKPSISTYHMVALATLASRVFSSPQNDIIWTATTATTPAPLATPVAAGSSVVACNNSPDLCDRSYGNITHMGAHDSSFLRDSSTQNSIAGNQYFNATVALDAGIRLLQVQVHDLNGTIEMCHTTCGLLDAGSLQDWLVDVNHWLDKNPNDVVTILIVNSDSHSAAKFGAAFEGSGIARHAFTPLGGEGGWPTLRAMITTGTRLVTFIAPLKADTAHPYLLPEFDYVFETAYEVTSPTTGFNCTIDRPSTQATSKAALVAGFLPLVNHFAYKNLGVGILIPDVENVAVTNSPSTTGAAALAQHAQACYAEWGFKPTFMLVDFFSEGPAIRTADMMNGVVDPVGRKNITRRVTDADSPEGGAGRRSGAAGMGTGALVAFIAAALVLT